MHVVEDLLGNGHLQGVDTGDNDVGHNCNADVLFDGEWPWVERPFVTEEIEDRSRENSLKNFAGKLSSDPSKAILTTLQHSFEHCRAFHDAEPMSREELLSGFINMVCNSDLNSI